MAKTFQHNNVVNITASPATGVSYFWDNGSTSATRVVSAAVTYSVTLTDTVNGYIRNGV